MDKNNETKGIILQTALEMIKQEGFEKITIRGIAQRSNTNVALVNYYFGSKDKLISEVIRILLSGFQESFEVLDDLSLPPEQRLKRFLLHYVQGIEQYPELLSRVITMGANLFASQQEYGEFMRVIGFDKIKSLLKELTHEQDQDILMMMVMQVFGAVFMPALMKQTLEAGSGIEVKPVERQIDLLLERYFSNKKM
ncbi:TetR family transcriptional regulator [Paenibacillus barcinonensis]|uniref:TetR family transcriptional regulator n=2 Tax=Paenibacillus barcinonensis TaxID=198119 RepID=A0A2V4VZ34_PAEBA|nr:TetR/AcrR family transcriptional regulator [Paenibacillus barcinonensis]PYE47368.1 TetR family transcriptional regulator [Paenibacillus barcinonensis]